MNKRRTKSPWKLLLILVVVLSLIIFTTACGTGEETPENSEELENTEEEMDDSEEEEVENSTEGTDDTEDDNNSNDSDEDPMSEDDIASLLSESNVPDEYYYDQTIKTGEYTSTQKFWYKGEKMKIEGEQEGVPYIIIWTEDSMTNLDPQSKTAFRTLYQEDMEEENTEGMNDFYNTENFDFENDENFKYLGKDTVNGESCHVIESTFSEDNSVSKVWIHEEYGIVMKTQVTGATEEMNSEMEVTNLNIGGVSDDEFEIPDDYQIMEY